MFSLDDAVVDNVESIAGMSLYQFPNMHVYSHSNHNPPYEKDTNDVIINAIKSIWNKKFRLPIMLEP